MKFESGFSSYVGHCASDDRHNNTGHSSTGYDSNGLFNPELCHHHGEDKLGGLESRSGGEFESRFIGSMRRLWLIKHCQHITQQFARGNNRAWCNRGFANTVL